MMFLSPQDALGVSGVNSDSVKVTPSSDVIKQQKKKPQQPFIRLVWCHQSVHKPWHSYLTRNMVIYILYLP